MSSKCLEVFVKEIIYLLFSPSLLWKVFMLLWKMEMMLTFFCIVHVGVGCFRLLHLFYAAHVIFLGDWVRSNICNIVIILQCFYLASRLKINMKKLNLYGVSVPFQEVEDLALVDGCKADRFPFTYFRLPVGQNMSIVVGWSSIKKKFKKKISNWKVYRG